MYYYVGDFRWLPRWKKKINRIFFLNYTFCLVLSLLNACLVHFLILVLALVLTNQATQPS
ncbi:hypothetical protein K449DRAFT_159984 [Hypoxylon sp. EC38]|nr:hypothetical protein K449DRAFT_159984 [Hypoxylon sp. EC38]